MLEVKPLKYESLPGLTKKQLSEHHDVLYAGYVKKYNEICEKLKSTDLDAANGAYSEIRELQLEKSFALNGVKLHELYFENMTASANECNGQIKELIDAKWGSVEAWSKEFAATGISSRGWVVLGWDNDQGQLDTFLCDVHNQGGIWNTTPLLIMDVYEHAYFLDYATARKDYIAAFMNIIDWEVVNQRISKIVK